MYIWAVAFMWMPFSARRFCFVALVGLVGVNLFSGAAPAAEPVQCSVATLKGTYLYREYGLLDGTPYAESGREVYDGKGGIVLTYRGSDGSGGVLRARYTVDSDCLGSAIYPDGEKSATFVSPDGSTFVYTVIDASGDQSTVLSGTQVRVSP